MFIYLYDNTYENTVINKMLSIDHCELKIIWVNYFGYLAGSWLYVVSAYERLCVVEIMRSEHEHRELTTV